MREVIIIESPTKVHTISSFVKDKKILATKGHFKDLPKTSLGISIPDYTPTFVLSAEHSKRVISDLKRDCKGARVYVATDPDREGYAIGKMVYDEIKDIAQEVYRAEFFEITAGGVKDGIANAVEFEKSGLLTFDSFLGRRLLDRLIGYLMSPKASRDLPSGKQNVGRVKSIAMAMIVEREEAIAAFYRKPEKERLHYKACLYFEIGEQKIKAVAKPEFETEEDAVSFLETIENVDYAYLKSENETQKKDNPDSPLITSDLLDRADHMLGIDNKTTMKCAQRLFELGLITYHRVDSVRLSRSFTDIAKLILDEQYASMYQEHVYINKNTQSDAHEAIRPSNESIQEIYDHKISVQEYISVVSDTNDLTADENKVLRLIYARAFASQAKSGIDNRIESIFDVNGVEFYFSYSIATTIGYRQVMHDILGVKLPNTQRLPLKSHEEYSIDEFEVFDVEKDPPRRYSEGDLTKQLERYGIGRPSTYVSYLDSIKNNDYVEIKKRKIFPTGKALEVVQYLREKAPWLIDYKFTADVELFLDEIVHGKKSYVDLCKLVHQKMDFEIPGSIIMKPSQKQIDYAKILSEKHGISLDEAFFESSDLLKQWIKDALDATGGGGDTPSENLLKFAESISAKTGISLGESTKKSKKGLVSWIDKNKNKKPKNGVKNDTNTTRD